MHIFIDCVCVHLITYLQGLLLSSECVACKKLFCVPGLVSLCCVCAGVRVCMWVPYDFFRCFVVVCVTHPPCTS